MCGIVGIVGFKSKLNIDRMVSAMRHRGPDDHGIYADENVMLGMTRLSILDLSACGHQPMLSHCGRYYIVYNGECYNYREIRASLESLGDRFVSNSDTEVVLQAYAKWGTDCLGKINGMFAFAIWDLQEKKLFAARDRVGIKPFYFSKQGSTFLFASELKTMLHSGLVGFSLDPKAVMQYFTFGYIQQPHTILSEVEALMPGQYLVVKDGACTKHAWWNFDAVKTSDISYQEAKEELLYKIRKSVKMQMISDRPLGLFLSGGLDSATILAAMKYNNAQAHTFSIGFEANLFARSEDKEAEELANHFGAVHEKIVLSASTVQQDIPAFFEALDQPSIDGLNTYLVSKYASKSMTVALSGLGGDELFAGYSRHALLLWKSQHKNLEWLSRMVPLQLADKLQGRLGDMLWRMRVLGESSNFLLNYTFTRTINFSHEADIVPSWKESGLSYLKCYTDAFRHLDTAYTSDTLKRILRMEIYTFMSSQLLRDMDAVSMAHSLEVRFPLLDHELLAFAFSLPDHYKLQPQHARRPGSEGSISYRAGGAKRIVMDAMEPLLPPGFFDKSKNGFKLPVTWWLKKMDPDYLKAYIFDNRSYWEPYLDPQAVQAAYQSFVTSAKIDYAFWKILTFLGVIYNLNKIYSSAHRQS